VAPTLVAKVSYIWHGLTVRPPHKPRMKGKKKMPLYNQYSLETKRQQKASIRFKDGTTLHLNQQTDAVLRSPHLTYVKGEAYQTIAPGSNHQVQTASALAAAVGTSFDVKSIRGGSEFIVVHGALKVKGKSGPAVYVKPNQVSVVQQGQAAQQPQQIDAQRATSWTNGMPAAPVGENVALDANGGRVVAFSSQYTSPSQGNFWRAAWVIDGRLDYGWDTNAGHTSNEWVKIGFSGNKTYTLTKVLIDPAATHGDSPTADLKDFQIRVSTTGTDDASFTTVLTNSCLQKNSLQSFSFPQPVQAKYVELYLVDNYGSPDWITIAEFEAVSKPS
jgi:hypothetical protein